MTREEAITELTVHLGHWKRLKEEHIASVEESNRMIDALNMAIEALANGYVVHKEYKTFCGVPMEEAIEVIEKYKEQTTPTIPCFTESAEAYKAWTGEEMGKTHGRLIDADALSKKLCETTIFIKDGEAFQRMINDAPTVSADRPQGEWINREHCQVDEDAYEVATCSNCKAEITIEYPYDNFCPNCGKKMKGGDAE